VIMREEIEELMLLYVAGATDDAEAARVERLLASGDPTAQAAYAEALAVVHAIPQALPTHSPSRRVRDQLMLRVLSSTQPPQGRDAARPTLRLAWPAWIAGGIAAVLALGVMWLWQANERTRLELAMQVQEEIQTNRIVASPHVKLAKLGAADLPDNEVNPCARIMFCPVSNQFQLRVFNLTPPPQGRVYELWLITPDGRKVASGTFLPDLSGSATHFFRAPEGVDFNLAAITDEPAGGSPAPTGTIRLSGPLSTH
jgi:hypothetical protein